MIENQDIRFHKAGQFEETRFEKIHNITFDNSKIASKLVAEEIAELIRAKQKENKTCILGLATGSSPILVYAELVRLYQEENLSFKNVITFNLDEYYAMPKEHLQSYHYFMHIHLFQFIDIKPENIHIPDGMISKDKLRDYCLNYEKLIESCGGLDYQLLGIGRTGHIGFNEPGSHVNSITRSITLDFLTRSDAASDFHGLDAVPKKAITMGIGSVLKSKRIVLLAWGNKKATILAKTIEGNITSNVPATYLQKHNNTSFILDIEAASLLTRNKTPWLVRSCEWSPKLIQKAIVWLSNQTGKSILKLTDNDYNTHGMSSLLAQSGAAYDINIAMFNHFQHTITGWPGGKPNADDTYRPEREYPHKKRILIFSPHPDDDVISMGGTLDRLVSQGHDVYIAYQTSGSTAVSNIDALKYAEVVSSLYATETNGFSTDMLTNLKQDKSTKAIWNLKGLIRQKEALAAVRYLGIEDKNVYFLQLPFYETGKTKKLPITNTDITLTRELIEKIQPHQIYAAGDLADPHGTHKICLDAIYQAVDEIKGNDYMKTCRVWLYRGAWEEWAIDEIEMAVPLSPDQVLRKRKAIFHHQTQKDHVVYRGNDLREFWLRAEDRNKETAQIYNKLGLADYEALEAFKRYHF